jgi:hypothetical protein
MAFRLHEEKWLLENKHAVPSNRLEGSVATHRPSLLRVRVGHHMHLPEAVLERSEDSVSRCSVRGAEDKLVLEIRAELLDVSRPAFHKGLVALVIRNRNNHIFNARRLSPSRGSVARIIGPHIT